MLGPVGHIGAWLKYLATARRQHASDLLTSQQLALPAKSISVLPPGLKLSWLGTAGFRLEYQDTVLWIDPYVTRMGLGEVVRRRVVASSEALVARHVDRADAVLVGHTHFDHALDVPAIARRTRARVYGSDSCAHLMGLYRLAAQAVTIEPRKSYEVGPFRFHFVPSVHAKLILGLAVQDSGDLTCEHLDGLTAPAYKCGQVFGICIEVAGIRIYHQGSADLLDGEIVDRDIDIFLCGIAGRRFTPRYVERTLRALRPKLLIPMHHDNFFRPLDAPVRFSMNVNLTGFADEVHKASREVQLQTVAVGGAIGQ